MQTATMRGINRLFNLDKSLHELSDLGIQIEQTFRFASITELLYAKVEVKRYAFKEATFSLGSFSET